MSVCSAILVTRGNLVSHTIVGFSYLQTEDRMLGTLPTDDANSGKAAQKHSLFRLLAFFEVALSSNTGYHFSILCMDINKPYDGGKTKIKMEIQGCIYGQY